jgi:magnesium chelatase subunit I
LEEASELVDSITDDVVIHAGDDLPAEAYLAVLADLPAFEPPTRALAGETATSEEMAASLEFLLEGLHLTKRLNKDAAGARALYRQRRR